MDLKKLFASTTFSLAAVSAFADTYQSEIHLNLINSQEEGYDTEKGGLLSGTIFFKPVDLDGHPLAEAAFLEKSSNFKLSYGYQKGGSHDDFSSYYINEDNELTPYSGNFENKTTNSLSSAKIEYYVPNTMLYLAGAIDKLDHGARTIIKYDSPPVWSNGDYRYEGSESTTIWTASLGITPLDGLLVWSDYSKSEDDSSWGLNSKYVMDFRGHAINLEAGYTDTKNFGDIYRVAADYYINRSFSVGAVYYSSSNEILGDMRAKYVNDHMTDLSPHANDQAYGLRAKKFFANDIALDASFTKSGDGDKFSIGITKRF